MNNDGNEEINLRLARRDWEIISMALQLAHQHGRINEAEVEQIYKAYLRG